MRACKGAIGPRGVMGLLRACSPQADGRGSAPWRQISPRRQGSKHTLYLDLNWERIKCLLFNKLSEVNRRE